MASYNKFNTNVVRDTLIVTFGNCLTSFFAGFVIFSFLGALALKTNVDVEEVAQSGRWTLLNTHKGFIIINMLTV